MKQYNKTKSNDVENDRIKHEFHDDDGNVIQVELCDARSKLMKF